MLLWFGLTVMSLLFAAIYIRESPVLACAFLMIAFQSNVHAADVPPSCISINGDAARLDCYDRVEGRSNRRSASQYDRTATISGAQQITNGEPSLLSSVWELDADHKHGTFRLLPYKANYLLPIHYTNNPNVSPSSPVAYHTVNTPYPLSSSEVKFQISFKLKAWENIFKDNGDLWFGYTQQSYWQLYNKYTSSIRENDFLPEVMLVLRTDRNVLGWHWRMLKLGFIHQSNGRALPLSRSWNRIYADFGLERGNFVWSVHPWIRLPNYDEKEDNPDTRRYMGSGDTRLMYVRDGNVYSVLGRYSLIGGHGAIQLDWAYPISSSLKGYVQVFNGYGESLLDYNHSQTVLGVGILLVPW
jgi:phospholipase A1